MHSRIAVVWALFGCLPINSRVSLFVKLITTGHGGPVTVLCKSHHYVRKPWLRMTLQARPSFNVTSVESSACSGVDDTCFIRNPTPAGFKFVPAN